MHPGIKRDTDQKVRDGLLSTKDSRLLLKYLAERQSTRGLSPTFAALVDVFQGFLEPASCGKFPFSPDNLFCVFFLRCGGSMFCLFCRKQQFNKIEKVSTVQFGKLVSPYLLDPDHRTGGSGTGIPHPHPQCDLICKHTRE